MVEFLVPQDVLESHFVDMKDGGLRKLKVYLDLVFAFVVVVIVVSVVVVVVVVVVVNIIVVVEFDL